ncbi:hypothetical protein CN680_01930 [Bacillus pseudomycoides]|nr:hypothetical protein CON79_25625 [Bacillus pseudomycoides]PED72352.1 hypothetical protein CON97_08955 [Bacillus pseudomycoides]PEI39513.1 hypothetical protein CN620_18920 [Bacillus pseudomycoides]PEJ81621.1 hypothetical protein CN680_01930 [Bacillus pseudomycoides]PEM18202.1 hypothetical protein CN628_08240 [Bacillus pseudomycoides]
MELNVFLWKLITKNMCVNYNFLHIKEAVRRNFLRMNKLAATNSIGNSGNKNVCEVKNKSL